ncbi:serine/threonine protein phosphatase 2A 55 kDa regulatory subunit B beta isoform-like [Asparagus officinalis]|uniref:serine/threonine protein phosphatase 2A 55 kDa regulatory subunit B beta isoform-like n=1 Tax=Asparagus officinalis TaxID=4686 RepID=UPI00098E0FBE|nr:serine/threonine protein phosphatase 2A 55 kDa regulatory subunit B beta isoform-like [Asparagus officinalis]
MLFEENEAPGSRSFFTEIIASISDIKFGKDGRHILSRDYMTLKLWDISMDSGPVATFQVNEYLRPKGNTIYNYLCDLYENDSIFGKFECYLSGDGQRVATGSYINLFRIFGCATGSNETTTLEASKNPMRYSYNSTIQSVLKGLVSLDKSFNEKNSDNLLKQDNGLSRLKFVDNDANWKNGSTMAAANRKKYEIVIMQQVYYHPIKH